MSDAKMPRHAKLRDNAATFLLLSMSPEEHAAFSI